MNRNNFILISAGYLLLYGTFEILSRIFEDNIDLRYALIIFLVILSIATLIERFFFKQILPEFFLKTGFESRIGKAIAAAIFISIVLFTFYPVISNNTGYVFVFPENWILLQTGVFISHGLSEELIFRGFLFRHLRKGRTFWKAALLAVPFIAAAHLPIIVSQGFLVGGTAFILAVISSYPLSYLFENGGNTIWAPAIVHWAIDTIIPFLAAGEFNSQAQEASLYWMLISMVVPYLAFVFLRKRKINR